MDEVQHLKKTDLGKWNDYYIKAEKDSTSPPWESTEVFHALRDWISNEGLYDNESIKLKNNKNLKIIELGSGASHSSLWLAQNNDVFAIDISPEAIKRAKSFDKNNQVNWICSDLLDKNFFENNSKIQKESFDVVFDMQCFHVLRNIDEEQAVDVIYYLLKKGGKIMIIVGASLEPYGKDMIREESENKKGPPKITIDEFLIPFTSKGFKVLSIKLSKFNKTEVYGENPPFCWIGIFEKS